MIEFSTVQTQDNIKWPNFIQKPINNDRMRQGELWKQTCFELFVSSPETKEYREFNFSPSGLWNSYDFTDYRQDPKNAEIKSPCIKYVSSGFSMHLLSVTLPLENLMQHFSSHTKHGIQFGVTAVIQYSNQSYDYYAHKHCGQEPDFHLRNSFNLKEPLINS